MYEEIRAENYPIIKNKDAKKETIQLRWIKEYNIVELTCLKQCLPTRETSMFARQTTDKIYQHFTPVNLRLCLPDTCF